jgi:hypothetical protein
MIAAFMNPRLSAIGTGERLGVGAWAVQEGHERRRILGPLAQKPAT